MSVDLKPWKDGFQPHEGKIMNKKGIQIPLPGNILSAQFHCTCLLLYSVHIQLTL